MNKSLIFFFLLFTLYTFSQDRLKSSQISQYAYSLNVIESQIIGRGADTLKTQIRKSQFILLGEQHFSPQISKFTEALIPVLKESNFKYFAVETGPHSVKKMTQLIESEKSLFDFNSQFYLKYEDIPFPFFDGVTDEAFLQKALKEDFILWGLDQEFFTAHLFLFDEVYRLSNHKSDKLLFERSKKLIDDEFRKYKHFEDYPMFTNLLNSIVIDAFFDSARSNMQKQIVSDLKASWKIYALNESKNFSRNNSLRMHYMKQRFGENYFNVLKKDSIPKVFLKMGSMHLAEGKNWLGNNDLGNTITELSHLNGTKSTSINCFARYWMGSDGEIYDYLDEGEGKDYQPLLELAQKNSWVLIDTNPILELVKSNKIKLNKNLQILLSGFDYVLFTPIQTKVKPNYSNKL